MNVDSEVTPGHLESSQQAFVRAIVKAIAVLALALLPSLFLFYPFLHSWYRATSDATSLPPTIPDPLAEDLLLDAFIVRDASMSPDNTDYAKIENELLKRLSTKEGDRISYSVFGTDTFPPIIPAPSDRTEEVDAQRSATVNVSFKTTNFANLFDKLLSAVRDDRVAQKETRRAPHADAIFIISDGVPDLSEGALHCPRPEELFIPSEVVDKFDALIHQRYATQEEIYVRLILGGNKNEGCASTIEQAWLNALGKVSGPVNFRVLSLPDLTPNGKLSEGDLDRALEKKLEKDLLQPLRRQPRIVLYLMPFQEVERVKLDTGEVFSIQYAVQSFLRGGTLRVPFGNLEETKSVTTKGKDEVAIVEVARLHTLYDPNISATLPKSQPEIEVPSPPSGKLWGPVKKGSIYMKLEHPNYLVDSSTYHLRLSIDSESALEVQPSEPISTPPCSYARVKSAVRRNLGSMKSITIIVGLTFTFGVLFWTLAGQNNPHRWVDQLCRNVEIVFIENWKPWIIALITCLFPMSIAGIICAPRPTILYVAISLAAVFNFLSFYMEGSKIYPHRSPTTANGEEISQAKASMMLNLFLHGVQGVVLPLIIEGTAKQLF